MDKLTLRRWPSPPDHDADSVEWIDEEGKAHGSGYIGKEDGRIGLIRCPVCEKENYMMTVLSGVCARCGWNANAENETPTPSPTEKA